MHVNSVLFIPEGLLIFPCCKYSADCTDMLHKTAAFSACALLHSDQNSIAGVCFTWRQQIQCSSHSSAAERKSKQKRTGGCTFGPRCCWTPVSHCCGCMSPWAVPSCLHPCPPSHSCKRHQVHTPNVKQQPVKGAYLLSQCLESSSL